MPTIKCTWKQLQENGKMSQEDVILVSDLGKYGFDSDVINNMVEFDIFPQTFLIHGGVYVSKRDIFGSVNQILRNTMHIHRDVQEAEEIEKKFRKYIDENKIKLDDETIRALNAGEITMQDVKNRAKPEEESHE